MKKSFWLLIQVLVVSALFPVSKIKAAVELQPSVFELERHKIRYALASEENALQGDLSDSSGLVEPAGGQEAASYALKSPTKAFLLSLAVPGLGQFYYGSKIKPLVFFAAEVTSWAYYAKWHSEGNDLTDKFEQFNREHWIQQRYEDYLLWVYGETDDELIDSTEIIHHLPDTRTQQYYEMTGKYDQFAWGWDDAVLNGESLYVHFNADNPPPAIVDTNTTPYSARRLQYERMRNDANNKYDRATRMLIVSMANHIISAFEAYFVTKSRNRKVQSSIVDLARVKMKVDLKSYYTWRDTPFFTVTYKF